MSEYVLLTPEGCPYSEARSSPTSRPQKPLPASLGDSSFHDQRHTFASTLVSKGINSFTLRDILGHTSTRTTERYARPSNEALEAVRIALV
jgi:integrase